MKLEVPQVKMHVIPVRISSDLFAKTKKIGRENRAGHSTILRLLIEKGIEVYEK